MGKQGSTSNNLKALREASGMTQEQAAARFGLSKSGYIKIEDGDRGLKVERIAKAAEIYGIDPAHIIGEIAQEILNKVSSGSADATELLQDASSQAVKGNARFAADAPRAPITLKGPRDVPVHGTGSGGTGGDFRFNGQTIDHAPRPPGIQDKQDVYVVYVVGESMVPRFEDGDPVYVDPKRPPRAGDYVVVELHGPLEGEPGDGFVKRLVRRGAKVIVEQFNPPKQIEWSADQIKAVHRIIPWIELVGI